MGTSWASGIAAAADTVWAVTATTTPAQQRAPWRRWALATLGAYVAGAVVFLAVGGGAPEANLAQDRTPGTLGPVHDIAYETLDGEPTTLAQYAGQPLVINFFASWCPPCIEEMPDLQRFHQEHGGRHTVVGLAVEGSRPARDLVEEVGVTYDIGLDQRDILIELGGVAMPTTVFVSSTGQLLDSHSGILQYDDLVDKAEELFGS